MLSTKYFGKKINNKTVAFQEARGALTELDSNSKYFSVEVQFAFWSMTSFIFVSLHHILEGVQHFLFQETNVNSILQSNDNC